MEKNHVKELVKENVKLTYKIRDHLLRGHLFDFGIALNEAWQLKRNFSQKISNLVLDDIYQGALNHGAIGGKLLGAGGGGFFLFYSPPFRRHELVDYLTNQGSTVLPFKFDHEGLKAWMVREHRALSKGV
jgi:D-glycero-alpha-D-manno-heptose-7-phosphate kinase